MKILIAEDSVALASLLAKFLRRQGYATQVVFDGERALEALASGGFSLVILDLDLFVIHGTQVLERLRAVDRELPVLVITGFGDSDRRVACLDGGADDYITKPVALAEVAARVRALMRRTTKSSESVLRVADLELDACPRGKPYCCPQSREPQNPTFRGTTSAVFETRRHRQR